jgi:mono/diheme cytochrome c family protein
MRRTHWVAGLAVFSVVALAACGGGDGADTGDMADDSVPSASPAPAEPAPADPAGGGQLPEGVTPEMVAQGQQIFSGNGNCVSCHGADGSGTTLAPNLRDSEWINIPNGTFDEIIGVVQTGVAQPQQHPAPMPAMGGATLSEEQVRAVSAYVYSISHGG